MNGSAPGVVMTVNSRGNNPAGVAAAAAKVALLTGGDDRSYALGLATSLMAQGVFVDFIGSDKVDGPELHGTALASFLNLRGDQSESASLPRKVIRLLAYYLRLLKYAVTAKPRVFHILWNNKFEWFDRTLLLLYYRLLGRKIVFTAHNVNAAKRDGCDSAFNRFTLGIQYRLVSHIFVHTQRMKDELLTDFGVAAEKVSVIPFGINATTPLTSVTGAECRARLGIQPEHKVVLFFGQIAPYKGLEYLVAALPEVIKQDPKVRLVIAGKVKKGNEDYWSRIEQEMKRPDLKPHIIARIEHIPDAEVEVYFKAADVLVIPYVHIFQSGVPFLAYNFGLPVIATDVGSLQEDIVDGVTGWICPPQNPSALAGVIQQHLSSDLHCKLQERRSQIRQFAREKYSWERVAKVTTEIYQKLI